jgi:hypothetical protein
VLVSFTAVARNDPQAGISAAPFGSAAAPVPQDLILPARTPAGVAGPSHYDSAVGLPRPDLKADAAATPVVERGRKGDPAGALLATLSRRGAEMRAHAVPASSQLLFGRDEEKLPPTILMPGSVAAPDWEATQSLEPWAGEDPTTTRNASSVQSPAAAAAGSTGAARNSGRHGRNGATPQVARAVALASTTPAPADATPLAIAALPVSLPGPGGRMETPSAPRPGAERSRYADLISPDHSEREQRCLAEAVYFEARSEPEEGQAAVAQVVLNRVKSGLYPTSVCGVVYQNRHRHLACQFSFACEGKSLRISDSDSWDTARRVARDVIAGRTYLADVGAATHYHANYVRPSWSRRLKKMDVIGRHIFYKLRLGQTCRPARGCRGPEYPR